MDELTSTLLQYDIVNLDGAIQEEILDYIHKDGMIETLVMKLKDEWLEKLQSVYENILVAVFWCLICILFIFISKD